MGARALNLLVPHLGTLLGGDRETGGFGMVVGIGLALAAIRAARHNSPSAAIACALAAAALTLASVAHPRALAPLSRLFRRVTQPIGRVVSTILLGAIYLCAFAPMALVLRLLGRQPLHASGPGWNAPEPRDADEPARRRYERMF
jgi:hypothetical protein